MTKGTQTTFIPGKAYPMKLSQTEPKMARRDGGLRRCDECDRWKAVSSFKVEGHTCKYCRQK